GGVVADRRHAQPGGGIDDGVVAAELVQALIEQARHHRGGAVERVRRLAGPEARLGDAPPPALAERHAERVFGGLQCGEPSVGGLVAADPAHPLGEDGVELDPVPVAVDDRVAEARADLRGSLVAVAAHVPSSDDDGFVFSAATGGRPWAPCREVITRLGFAPSPGLSTYSFARTPSSRALRKDLGAAPRAAHVVNALLSERADPAGAGCVRRAACCPCHLPSATACGRRWCSTAPGPSSRRSDRR